MTLLSRHLFAALHYTMTVLNQLLRCRQEGKRMPVHGAQGSRSLAVPV